MALKIEINDNHIQDLIQFYVEKQKTLKTEIAAREKEIKDISAIILQLKSPKNSITGQVEKVDEGLVYSTKWPWAKKISFVLHVNGGKPLTTKEIVDEISIYEPEFISDRKRAIASVSSTLSVKADEFYKEQGESGDYEYSVTPNNSYFPSSGYGYVGPDKIPIQTYGTNMEVDDLPF